MSVLSDSDIEEIKILNYIGKKPSADTLSILVLSSNLNFTRNLHECLHRTYYGATRQWKLVVHCSLNVADLVRHEETFGSMAIDFVVLAIDGEKIFCLEWARKMIRQCHPDLRLGRMLLVNGSNLPTTAMQVQIDDILKFRDENNLRMLNANLQDETDCLRLSKQILTLLENSAGVNTGIPNLIT